MSPDKNLCAGRAPTRQGAQDPQVMKAQGTWWLFKDWLPLWQGGSPSPDIPHEGTLESLHYNDSKVVGSPLATCIGQMHIISALRLFP